MKKLATLIVCSTSLFLHSQTTIFTESFGTGCDQHQLADGLNPTGAGTWTVANTGANDGYPNQWFISATEAGMGAGNCGDGCLSTGGTNRTLHVGANLAFGSIGDPGAAYLAGPGFANSNMRVESPTINCGSYINMSLSFLYMHGGVAGSDYFEIQYSTDNGATWSLVSSPAQTPTPCAPQGQWTAYTVNLPAGANNNPNVKFGFRWQNVDGSGADPSVAIDDIVLQGTVGGGPTITTVTPSGSPFCAGDSIVVPYTITGSFTAGNVFTAQLSSSTGSFASPTNIGSVTSTSAGNINCVIPAGTATGFVYFIRVISSTPSITGSNTSAITINAAPTATASNTGPYCAGNTIALSSTGGSDYDWVGPNAYVMPNTQNPTITGSTLAMGGTYTVTVTSGSCSSTATTSVSIVDCSGIENEELDQTKVYPNPASDNFTLNIHDNMVNECMVTMVNMVGETVYAARPSQKNIVFNTQSLGLKSGIYLININYMSSNKVIKLIIR